MEEVSFRSRGLEDTKQRFKFDKALKNLERSLIERTLVATNSNRAKAASILNLSEANFRYRMKKFGLQPKRNLIEQDQSRA